MELYSATIFPETVSKISAKNDVGLAIAHCLAFDSVLKNDPLPDKEFPVSYGFAIKTMNLFMSICPENHAAFGGLFDIILDGLT